MKRGGGGEQMLEKRERGERKRWEKEGGRKAEGAVVIKTSVKPCRLNKGIQQASLSLASLSAVSVT